MPPPKRTASLDTTATAAAAAAATDTSILSTTTTNGNPTATPTDPKSPTATTATTTATSKRKSQSNNNNANDEVGIDDLVLPRSLISRIARGVLPPNTSLQKDALLALTKSATVFVSYLASQANELATRKTVQPGDVIKALKECEFENILAVGAGTGADLASEADDAHDGEGERHGGEEEGGLETTAAGLAPTQVAATAETTKRGRLEREIEVYEEGIRDKRKGYREKVKARESAGAAGATEAAPVVGAAEREVDGEPLSKRARRARGAGEEGEEEEEEDDDDDDDDEEGMVLDEEEEMLNKQLNGQVVGHGRNRDGNETEDDPEVHDDDEDDDDDEEDGHDEDESDFLSDINDDVDVKPQRKKRHTFHLVDGEAMVVTDGEWSSGHEEESDFLGGTDLRVDNELRARHTFHLAPDGRAIAGSYDDDSDST